MEVSNVLAFILLWIASSSLAAVLHYEETLNGFTTQPKGWNSWALQETMGFQLTQDTIIEQCDAMNTALGHQGYKYCSIDSGWSVGDHGDDYGRILYDADKGFDMPALANYLHDKGMLLGIYLVPGFFHKDVNKYIYGHDPPIQLSTISDGNCDVNSRCQFNYSAPGVQDYCNSNVDRLAQWGVDLIKLDFVTPGSPESKQPLDPDQSGVVVCYHTAIKQSTRQMRLDISYKLEWENEYYYNVWASNADSIRLDQDINAQGSGDQTAFTTVQRTIEMYRRYTRTVKSRTDTLTIYPDLDNLLVGNSESSSGLTDDQRRIVYSHWIGAGANLILGSDMTDLDDLGTHMLQNEQFNWLADHFTSKYPMRPGNGNNNADQGSQIQLWVAGPNNYGQALVVWANYGTQNLNLYAEPHYEGEVTSTWTTEALKSWGLSENCYSASNLWNPGDNVNLKNFSSIETILADEEVLVLFLEPNQLASYCDRAFAEH